MSRRARCRYLPARNEGILAELNNNDDDDDDDVLYSYASCKQIEFCPLIKKSCRRSECCLELIILFNSRRRNRLLRYLLIEGPVAPLSTVMSLGHICHSTCVP